MLVSELSGKSNIAEKLAEYGLEQDAELLARVLDRVQDLENEGYQFEAAEASFVLLVERLAGRHTPLVRAARLPRQRRRASADREPRHRGDGQAPRRRVARAHRQRGRRPGQRPRRRLAQGPRAALPPARARCSLVDYKVRVINARAGTAARVRVVIESKDQRRGLGHRRRLRERHRGELAGAVWTPSNTSCPRTRGRTGKSGTPRLIAS